MTESCCVCVGDWHYSIPSCYKVSGNISRGFLLKADLFPPLPEHLLRVHAYLSISSTALYRLQLYIAYSSKSPLALCRL